MRFKWPVKAPGETLDYEIDWSARIGASDPISTVTWTVPAGVTKASQNEEDLVTVIWLTGGTTGESYEIVCRVETDGGRIFEETVILPVKAS